MGKDTILAKVWRDFIEDEKYRIANASDFRIPEWAIKRMRLQAEEYEVPSLPAKGIGHAVIVVKAARTDGLRFALVIFNVDEGETLENQKDAVHWFYKNRDLSRTVLGASSGGLQINEFSEDVMTTSGIVGWAAEKHDYVCKETHYSKDF